MKNRTTLNAAMLLGGWLLAGAAAQACSPPPISPPPRPTGIDGKLPVTYPDLSTSPTPSPNPCPIKSYGYTASMPSLNDAETDRLYASENPLAPAWDGSRAYTGGELVSYNGEIYKARWWTQNDLPGNAYGPWELQASASGPAAWNGTRVYNAGDQASFKGTLYRAKWWTQGNEPGVEWGPWEAIGAVTPTPQPVSTPTPAAAPVPSLTGISKPPYYMPSGGPVLGARPAAFKIGVNQVEVSGQKMLEVGYSSTAAYTNYRYVATAECTIAAESTLIGDGSSAPPQYVELRMDGRPVGRVHADQFISPPPYPGPPPPDLYSLQQRMRLPDGSCMYKPGDYVASWSSNSFAGTQVTVRIPRGNGDYWKPDSKDHYLSAWACNGNLCRPSTLLWHTRMGTPAW
ncbi:carbohydrate-binding protein [Chitinilyticum aquatile]|uniref:carbohydrate-binding protein n=1 Tax=Chitinilyticum aquatile TaxID=362520 RepID=UPI0003F690E1|nr:carbohydrate-binding protein [Chitinilyticum aquatile]